MKKVVVTLGLVLCIVGLSHAGTWSWSNSNYLMGSYVPVSGSFSEYWWYGQYVSTTNFNVSSANVVSIRTYNDGYGQGGSCYGSRAYLTVDMTAVADGVDEELDGNAIYSNLPNPKYDLESDNIDSADEESEVVVLGTLSAKGYYMTTYWIDNRDGSYYDGGVIQVQFAMSKQGWSDYNNCVTSSSVQIVNRYGRYYGNH